jgi:membrane protein implicated in regulation of membrane protease activity
MNSKQLCGLWCGLSAFTVAICLMADQVVAWLVFALWVVLSTWIFLRIHRNEKEDADARADRVVKKITLLLLYVLLIPLMNVLTSGYLLP